MKIAQRFSAGIDLVQIMSPEQTTEPLFRPYRDSLEFLDHVPSFEKLGYCRTTSNDGRKNVEICARVINVRPAETIREVRKFEEV